MDKDLHMALMQILANQITVMNYLKNRGKDDTAIKEGITNSINVFSILENKYNKN